MKRLGQYFLKNRSAIKKIIDALELESEEMIVEVGAGHGELTENLKIKKDSGGEHGKLKIVAIEKDRNLIEILRKKFEPGGEIEIIEGDILKILPQLIHDQKSPVHQSSNANKEIKNWKLTGNIPYYITGHILRIIGELKYKPKISVFTIQKEVAERIGAGAPRMNKLAASVQFWAKPKILAVLSRKEFEPQPGVDSAIIKLETRGGRPKAVAKNYYKTIRILFQQPRKTIINNLFSGLTNPEAEKREVAEKLGKIGVNPKARPQDLNVQDIIKISKMFG